MDNQSEKQNNDELLTQLSECKETMARQEDQILQLELKLERQALDHKIAMQDKEDVISEEKLTIRHKDQEL